LLPFHVLGGAVAIVFGLLALAANKGARLHRKSGTVFVYAMLLMSLSGAAIASGGAPAAVNIPAGLVTAYLVLSGLLTVRPPSARVRRVEHSAMVAAFALSVGTLIAAIVSTYRSNMALAVPVALFAVVAFLAGVGDW